MRLPDPGEAEAAVTAITNRRVTCGDPDLDLMPDDPLGLIRYLRNHQRVPRQALAQDAGDGLRIVRCLRADLDRAEHALISIAREARVSWPDIAGFLELRSPEGAMLRHQRLESAIAGGPRSEVAAREERRADLRRRQAEGQREGWALSHARTIEDAAREVLASPLPADETENAEEVEVALGSHPASPGEVWEALRVLLPGLPADALTPVARDLIDGLLADWDTRFPVQN